MIVKTYTAESAASALKQIRNELGGDAIILKTTKGTAANGRAAVYVTACAEQLREGAAVNRLAEPESSPVNAVASFVERMQQRAVTTASTENTTSTASVAPQPVTSSPAAAAQRGFQLLSQIDQKLDQLLARESASVRVASEAGVSNSPDQNVTPTLSDSHTLEPNLRTLLEAGYSYESAQLFLARCGDELSADQTRSTIERNLLAPYEAKLTLSRGDIYFVVGLPGAGKSSVIGTLTRQIMFDEKLPVRLATLDSVRIAAADELATYADLLGASVLSTSQVGRLPEGITLIDTPALVSDGIVAQIATHKSAHPSARVIAVVPSIISDIALQRFLTLVESLSPSGIIFSMRDQSEPLPLAVSVVLHKPWTIYGAIDAGNGAGDLSPLLSSPRGVSR